MGSDAFRHLDGVRMWGAVREMNAVETMFWRGDTSAGVDANLVGVVVLDRVPEWDRLVARHRWISGVAPLLRRRPVEPPLRLGRPFWADDPTFEVDRHLHRARLPSPGTWRQLLDLAQAWSMTPFHRAWPLWQAVLVEGVNGHGAAYLLKMHHSLTDGTGAAQLMSLLVDVDADLEDSRLLRPLVPEAARGGLLLSVGRLSRLLGRACSGARGMWARHASARRAGHDGRPPERGRLPNARAVLSLAKSFAHATLLPSVPSSPLLARRNHRARFEVLDVPFDALKAAGAAAGGTANDAYLAALACAFERYHRRFGVALDVLPALLPISVRRPGAAGGNHLASTRLVLPVDRRTPAERVRLVHDSVAAVRGGATLHALSVVSRPITPLPPSWVGQITAQMFRGNDLLASNFPGLPHEVHLAGARVTAFYPYPPLLRGAASIALTTYQGRAHLGVNLDSAAVTEPDVFLACLREGFDEVIRSVPSGDPAAEDALAVPDGR